MCGPQVRFCERLGGAIPRAYSTLPVLQFPSNSASIPIDRFPALLGFPGVAADGPLLHENHSSVNPAMWKQCKVHQAPSMVRTEKAEFCTRSDFGSTRIAILTLPWQC